MLDQVKVGTVPSACVAPPDADGQTAASGQTRLGRLRANVVHIATAEQTLALIDQAVVSGASFVTTVLLGRYTDASELGTYALAASLLIWLINAQEAFVALPYTLNQDRSSAKARGGHALIFCAALSVFATLGIAATDIFAVDNSRNSHLVAIMWSLAVVAPFVIHRDFARRHSFAGGRNLEALVLDCTIAALQIGILAWLAWMDMLSSVTALWALGASCAVALAGWFWTARRRFRIGYTRIGDSFQYSWHVGKWLFVNQLLTAIQSQITLWTLAIIVGTSATGIYIACMSVALFTNPFIIGLSNMLWGKAARTFQEGSSARLLRASIIDTALLGTILILFCLIILVAGEDILQLLFPSGEYASYHDIVTILAFSQLACGIGMPASSALAGMGYVRTNSALALAETVVMAILALPLVALWGITGAASAILIVAVIRAITRWTAFVILARTHSSSNILETDSAEIAQLLGRVRSGSTERWVVNALDLRGCQAHVFLATPDNEKASAADRLIVKLYRTERRVDDSEVKDQYTALHRLHALLDGRTWRGWTLRVPAPIMFSRSPLVLAMTAVPGQNLSEFLADFGGDLQEIDTLAEAVAQAQLTLWESGLAHGDLTIENILCDVPARVVSFVDAGPKAECGSQWQTRDPWALAIHDLAHLLAHEGETLVGTWAHPKLRNRRKRFVEQVVREVIDAHPVEGRAAFLTALDACVRSHLTPAAQVYGLYRKWLDLRALIALSRATSILRRLATECDAQANVSMGAAAADSPEQYPTAATATERTGGI